VIMTEKETLKCSEKNVPQCHFVYHKSNMHCNVIDSGLPHLESGLYWPDATHLVSLCSCVLYLPTLLNSVRVTARVK
jgi:hypothetical protein